ncbi:piggyBac transposable element-derived protein 4-like [Procambarus clarkii]|uniref:piggyBac transposable element-derived protein 4-like n=1 Tax=Procambarus clarkii TaxID=6728 RepID=UPI003742FAE4
MDPGQGTSSGTQKGAKKSDKEDPITLIYKKYRGVKLTLSKIPGLVEVLSDAEDADIEGDEPECDILCDLSSSEQDSFTESEDESEVEAPAPPRGKRTRPVPRGPKVGDALSRSNTPPIVDDFTANPGLTIPKPTTALQFVQIFFTRALVEYLTFETNLYASHIIHLVSETSRNQWKPVSVKEMARYLGLCQLMGIIKLPTMRMYWQTNKLWHARFFNVFMSSRQFQRIAKFFHAYNNKAVPENNSNRLIKVRPLMAYFTKKFAEVPKKELSLDEGTMPWRGRLSFKVYNPNKPDIYGIKLYMLAEGTSGYIYDFDVYSGIGKTTVETVMGLIEPLVNKGYHLYMDNYYNSVTLTEKLREVGVYTCGTLRLQRGARKDLQQQAKGKLASDTTLHRRKDNTFVIVWKDKRIVSLITNLHNADTTEIQRRKRICKRDRTTGLELATVNKLKAICDYNPFMKGVDHFDQMVKDDVPINNIFQDPFLLFMSRRKEVPVK